jgi:hypothetical protein
MDYFSYLPITPYRDLQSGNTVVNLTNILTRSAFLKEIVENTSLFYEYQVKDGETPEIIADKLYGSPHRYWIILLFNKVTNPFYDFPLTNDELNSLITSKYGLTVEQSLTTIHHYELRTKYTILLNGTEQSSNEEVYVISAKEQDNVTGIAINRPSLPGTADTSTSGDSWTESFDNGVTVNVSQTYWAISVYNYELSENEKRRTIRLLDTTFIVPVENEFRRLMRDE